MRRTSAPSSGPLHRLGMPASESKYPGQENFPFTHLSFTISHRGHTGGTPSALHSAALSTSSSLLWCGWAVTSKRHTHTHFAGGVGKARARAPSKQDADKSRGDGSLVPSEKKNGCDCGGHSSDASSTELLNLGWEDSLLMLNRSAATTNQSLSCPRTPSARS